MNFGTLLLLGFALTALVSAALAVATGKNERARARWMLVTSVALASVLAMIGAVPLALALLFVAAGQGLVTLHAIGVAEALHRTAATSEPNRVAPSHWLLIVLGIGGGAVLANSIGVALTRAGHSASGEAASGVAAVSFAEVAGVVLVDHGFATIFVALLLLAATVVAGFLATAEKN